jgi:tetratricopeptide (TPR) repeat protein
MKLVLDRLILIMGMVGIVWLMPLRFEKIAHPPQEGVVGFCGHDLVSTERHHIFVRNVETLETRRINYPDAAFLYTASKPHAGSCQLIPAQGWLCAKATPKSGPRLNVIDLSSARVVKRFQLPCDPPHWIVTRDGGTLVYEAGQGKLRCVDIAGEKTLWKCEHAGTWRISPNGRLVAVSQKESIDILECRSGQKVCRLPGEEKPGESMSGCSPLDFSNDGSLLVDNIGRVFDTQDGKQLYAVALSEERLHTTVMGRQYAALWDLPAIFTGPDSQRLAYLTYAGTRSDPTLVLADGLTGKILGRKSLQDVPSVRLRPRVSDNRLIWLDDTSETPQIPLRQQQWFARLARWIPWFSHRLGAELDNHWLLIDAAAGKTLFQTSDTLHAVSDDGRYLVTEGDTGNWRLYELPGKRLLWASILACLVWSVALADLRLLNRSGYRRLEAHYAERLKRKKEWRARVRHALLRLSVLLVIGSVAILVVYWQTRKFLADPVREVNELLDRSLGALQKGEFDRAIAYANSVLQIDPNRGVAYVNRGEGHRGKKEYDAAIADYDEALRHNMAEADISRAYNDRGYAYYSKSLDNYDQYMSDYMKAVKHNTNNWFPYANMASIYATHPDPKHRDGKKALEYARKALELSPNNRNAMRTLAAAYAECGDFEQAAEWQRKALATKNRGNATAPPDSDTSRMRQRLQGYQR